MEQTVNERIKILVSELRLTESGFAKRIEIPVSSLNSYTKYGKQPPVKLLEQIHNAYPTINLTWLVTGKGPTWLDDEPEQTDELSQCEKRNKYLQDRVMDLETQLADLKKKNRGPALKA